VLPREALATVRQELPDFSVAGASVVENRGAWEVLDEEGHVARVDETAGRLLGTIDREGGVMGFFGSLHMCALGCEGMPGYVPFLAKPAQVDGFDLTLGNERQLGRADPRRHRAAAARAGDLRPGAVVAGRRQAAPRRLGAAGTGAVQAKLRPAQGRRLRRASLPADVGGHRDAL
jgi:uncharacterized iron-regulated membrane protein